MGSAAASAQPAQQPPPQAQPNDPFAEARFVSLHSKKSRRYRQRYAAELQQMSECGFPNEEMNLAVLMQVDGNVATAMEILIEDANP